MKRIVSALLLALFLFNWFGYRLVISFMESKANVELEAQFDENKYDESQLVSMKIPVRYLPYYDNSRDFERVDGQLEIEGIQYKYVKRRIHDDSLEVLCIPNHTLMKLRTAENEFFKFSNDLQQEKKPGQYPHAPKFFSIDCYTAPTPCRMDDPRLTIAKYPSHHPDMITSCYFPAAEQPPDMA